MQCAAKQSIERQQQRLVLPLYRIMQGDILLDTAFPFDLQRKSTLSQGAGDNSR